MSNRLTTEREAEIREWVAVMAQRKDIRYYGAHQNMTDLLAELDAARARVTELEKAAEQIQHLHKDSPMGPCPVCVDGDAWVRGDDPTVPYPCPTARLAGAKDCDPPSFRAASEGATR